MMMTLREQEKQAILLSKPIPELAARFHAQDQIIALSAMYGVPEPTVSTTLPSVWNFKRNRHAQYDFQNMLISMPFPTEAIDLVLSHEFGHHLAACGHINDDDSKDHTEVFYLKIEEIKQHLPHSWQTSSRRVQFGV